MPIPQVRSRRLSVFCLAVLGLLLSSHPSFAKRWTWLVPSNTQINFNGQQAGTRVSLPEVLTNAGHHPVTVKSASLVAGGYALTTPTLPVTLFPGDSITLNVLFSPTASTNYHGTLTILYSRTDLVMKIPVTGAGNGTGAISAAPASLAFGTVEVGSSLAKTGTLTASGAAAVISSITTTNPEFRIVGLTLPLSLARGQRVPFTVKFSPQSSGATSAALSFKTNGSGFVASQTLSGSGTSAAAVDHTVSLSWQESATVTGYNVYRGTTSGGPYSKVNAAVDSMSAYTDTSVASGTDYFYVVTSVNGSGTESAYSAEVSAAVPTP